MAVELEIIMFVIKKVGDTHKVVYETSSIAQVRFIGTLEECEFFMSLGTHFINQPYIRDYVIDMKTLTPWL